MPAEQRWLSMPYRIEGDKLLVVQQESRSVLAAGSTVGTPAMEAVYGANYSDVAGGEVRYWKDPWGIVHVEGLCKRTAGIAIAQVILTLPAGYRPVQVGGVTCANNDVNTTNVKINQTGTLAILGFTNAAAAEARIYLCLQFRPDWNGNS